MQSTDWDRYYRSPVPAARLTRRYTGRAIAGAFDRLGGNIERIVELGGANSSFHRKLQSRFVPREYHVIDNNAYGLSLLENRGVILHRENCLDLRLELEADAVFSIGLVEHFDRTGTRKAVEAHFGLAKTRGLILISFPTATWLYRGARRVAEAAGRWRFPDERPLEREEVLETASRYGRLEYEKVLWPIVFTQRLMVFRKNA